MSPQVQEPKPCVKTMVFIYDYYKELVSINNIRQQTKYAKERMTSCKSIIDFFPPENSLFVQMICGGFYENKPLKVKEGVGMQCLITFSFPPSKP